MLASPTSTSYSHTGIVGQLESYDLHSPSSYAVSRPLKEKDTLRSQFSQENSNGTIRSVVRLRETGFVDTAQSRASRARFGGLANAYHAISWIFGFKEKYSLAFLIFFGGALVGFCLGRTMMMKPSNVRIMTVSGEWFWYRQGMYKPSIFIHIYTSIISGIFAVFQFLPAIRRRKMFLHRLNGYMVLILLTPSTISGAIVARRSFGGDLNVQSSFYVLTVMIIFASAMGIMYRKQTRKHRKWMLRTVAYAASPITGRLAAIAGRHIISDIGSYYSVWSCDQLLYVMTDVNAVSQSYPQCAQTGVDLSKIFVAVHAATNEKNGLEYGSAVRLTFGLALWVSIIIHIIGVEIYIRKTESSNQHRRGFVLERNDDDTIRSRTDDH